MSMKDFLLQWESVLKMEARTRYSFVEQPGLEIEETQCGLGRWKPRWLQIFASPKAYLINFCILGIIQGAFSAYLIGIMSTVEKRYAFDSKISGLILIADNISPILLSIPIGYYGGRAHRPRWIAMTMFVVVLSCFLCSLPYFVYGPSFHLLTRTSLVKNVTVENNICGVNRSEDSCASESQSNTIPAVSIFFIASFLEGIGSTAFFTIGTPYLDDNIKKKNSPVYLGSLFSFRMLGPVFGFLLASYCLKFYEDPYYIPNISPRDPRWIGAWWLGFLILGFLLLLFSIPMLLFPRRLPRSINLESDIKSKDSQPVSIREMVRTLVKLAKNPILMCHTASITLRIIGLAGYYILMSRYIESQFGKSASQANFFTGTTSLLTMIVGVMVGGVVIRKFRPRPRYLTGYMALVEVITVLGVLSAMTLGCDNLDMPQTVLEKSSLQLYNSCNEKCGCTTEVFEPLCSMDGRSTFFSPCFAGCDGVANRSSSPLVYTNCECTMGTVDNASTALNSSNLLSGVEELIAQVCPRNCNAFLPYILVLSISKIVASTARVGNSLVTLRCVNPKDKSMALGALNTVLSLFAFIPYPLIYGALADSVCLVWEESCGTRGNCWLYDSESFRVYLHAMTAAFFMTGTLFDIAVFFLSGRLHFFYEDIPADIIEKQEEDEDDEEIIYCKKNPPYQSVTTIQSTST